LRGLVKGVNGFFLTFSKVDSALVKSFAYFTFVTLDTLTFTHLYTIKEEEKEYK
jgi:hypothetical protein